MRLGKAQKYQPRLITIEHWGKNQDPRKLQKNQSSLLGKGITFDTGGLNLKPTNSIETMHLEMSGSAAVLGAMKSIALENVKEDIVGVIVVAENAISDRSYKPHAIIQSATGSIEIGNRDAEGRLALADGMTPRSSCLFSKDTCGCCYINRR